MPPIDSSEAEQLASQVIFHTPQVAAVRAALPKSPDAVSSTASSFIREMDRITGASNTFTPRVLNFEESRNDGDDVGTAIAGETETSGAATGQVPDGTQQTGENLHGAALETPKNRAQVPNAI